MKDKKNIKNIHTSKELDNRIFENTIYKNKDKKVFKLNYISLGVILMLFLSGAVIAKNTINPLLKRIKAQDNLKSLTISVDNQKELPEKSDLVCNKNINLKDVQEQLGIELLDFDKISNITFSNCEVVKDENGKIRTVSLYSSNDYIYDFISDILNNTNNQKDKKYFNLGIKFMSDKALEEDKEKFKNIVLLTGEEDVLDNTETRIENYHINSLNTDAIILENNIAYFVYDDVLYYYAVVNYTNSEMINILENIK